MKKEELTRAFYPEEFEDEDEKDEPEFCEECPYRDWGYVESELKENSDILFVGSNPSRQELAEDEIFTRRDPAWDMFKDYLREFNERGVTYSMTHAVKCYSPAKKDPGIKVIRRCKPLLEEDILFVKPKLIVVLGKTALWAMTGLATGILKLNGHILREQIEHKDALRCGIPIAVCLSPAFITNSKDPEKDIKKFEKGINPALSFFEEQERLPYAVKRTLPACPDEEVGFDIETTELNPLIPGFKIKCFSVSDGAKALFVKISDMIRGS